MSAMHPLHPLTRPRAASDGHRRHTTGGHGGSPPGAAAAPAPARAALAGLVVLAAAGLGVAIPGAAVAATASAAPTAYVANSGNGTVTPINTATNTPGTPTTVGDAPDATAGRVAWWSGPASAPDAIRSGMLRDSCRRGCAPSSAARPAVPP
jgi:hypothetical protein